jgi:hypothetical protein
MHSWRGQNLESAFNTATNKHVARKQGQRDQLDPVLPSVRGRVKRKEAIESFACQYSGRVLLVLVANMESVPARLNLCFATLYALVHEEDLAPPSDLQASFL